MKISTRGRYALRVMTDLAERSGGEYIPLKDIILRQGISQKYLEGIMTDLSKAGVVDAKQGKGGGYKLAKSPDSITVGDILRVTEGELSPVSCLDENARPCLRAAECRTLPMWTKLYAMINDFFNGYSLADLMQNGSATDNYVI